MRIEHVNPGAESELSFAVRFCPGLLAPDIEFPNDVSGPNQKTAVKRFNIYRNNITVSLIDALAAIFPATQRITGVEFFRAMARFHIQATPPLSPLLFEYGHEFPDFIARYEYAQSMPWLADVASLERAWLDALTPVFRRFEAKPPAEINEIYASFLAQTSTLKNEPTAWTDFFLPDLHDRKGS